jgi:septin family protein
VYQYIIKRKNELCLVKVVFTNPHNSVVKSSESMKTFQHPFTMMISGPSGSGKTCFVVKLLENAAKMITPYPGRIIWHYGQWQSTYDTIKGVEFKQGQRTQ